MTWGFTDDHANENEALQDIGGAAAWYGTCGDLYCRRKEVERRKVGARLDFIPTTAAFTLFPDAKAKAHVAALVRVGLWQPVEGGFVIVGYAEKYGHAAAVNAPVSAPPLKPTPSQLGGQARAAQASRGPAGKFQPKPSQLDAAGASRLVQPSQLRASEDPVPAPERTEEKANSSKDLTRSAREPQASRHRPVSFESACEIEIQERCQLLGTDAHLASYIQPERWPELLRLRDLFAEVSGLTNVELGPFAHHKGTQRLVAMFAAGHSLETLERAIRLLPKNKWWCDNGRKFGIGGLTMNVIDSVLASAHENDLTPAQRERVAHALAGVRSRREDPKSGPQLIATVLPPLASGGES